jgi:hypothetical protein
VVVTRHRCPEIWLTDGDHVIAIESFTTNVEWLLTVARPSLAAPETPADVPPTR